MVFPYTLRFFSLSNGLYVTCDEMSVADNKRRDVAVKTPTYFWGHGVLSCILLPGSYFEFINVVKSVRHTMTQAKVVSDALLKLFQ